MWEVWLTAASLFVLPWSGVASRPASSFDVSDLTRVLGAFILLFVLPGVALSRLILRRFDLGPVTRIAVTLTLSMSATIVGGFVLDLLPAGLRPLTWLALVGVIIVGSLLAGSGLTALDRYRAARDWALRRFGFGGLRLSSARARDGAELDPANPPQARDFTGWPAGAAHGNRLRDRAWAVLRPSAWSRRVTGLTLPLRKRFGEAILHQLGFTGVRITIVAPRTADAWYKARAVVPARRSQTHTTTARYVRTMGHAQGRGAPLPHWPSQAAVRGRRREGRVFHRLGFAGLQVVLIVAPERPVNRPRPREHTVEVPARLWRDAPTSRPARSGLLGARRRGPAPPPRIAHRLGFAGVRLVFAAPTGYDRVAPTAPAPAARQVTGARPARPIVFVPYGARRLLFSPLQLALLTAALALTGYAFVSAVTTVESQRRAGFTQLWITTDKGARVSTLAIGVTSQELTATSFRLVVVSGDRSVAEWPVLVLAPGESFFAHVAVDPATLAVPSVSVVLYRLDNPTTPYRLVQAGVQP